jgi:hypothetical protein
MNCIRITAENESEHVIYESRRNSEELVWAL